MGTMSKQLSVIKSGVFAKARVAEEAHGAPLLTVQLKTNEATDASFAQYNLAQEECGRVWSLATLETGNGQLKIEGRIPKIAILDTGAGGIILGKPSSLSSELVDTCWNIHDSKRRGGEKHLQNSTCPDIRPGKRDGRRNQDKGRMLDLQHRRVRRLIGNGVYGPDVRLCSPSYFGICVVC